MTRTVWRVGARLSPGRRANNSIITTRDVRSIGATGEGEGAPVFVLLFFRYTIQHAVYTEKINTRRIMPTCLVLKPYADRAVIASNGRAFFSPLPPTRPRFRTFARLFCGRPNGDRRARTTTDRRGIKNRPSTLSNTIVGRETIDARYLLKFCFPPTAAR